MRKPSIPEPIISVLHRPVTYRHGHLQEVFKVGGNIFVGGEVFNCWHRGDYLWTLTLPVFAYIQRTALGKLSSKVSRHVSLPHDRSLGLSPINITRLGSDCLAVDGREGPSPLYPRKAAPARPRERLSLGSARNTGTFDFTRTGNLATLTDRVTIV